MADRPLSIAPGAPFRPAEIAESGILTAREKIELLLDLKAEVTGEYADPFGFGFGPADIDDAISTVRERAATGTDSAPVGSYRH